MALAVQVALNAGEVLELIGPWVAVVDNHLHATLAKNPTSKAAN